MNKTYIGKIIGTFGIKGELKVYSESDFIQERFKKGNEIILKSNKTEITVKVSSCRIHKNNVLIIKEISFVLVLVKSFSRKTIRERRFGIKSKLAATQ